MPELKVGEVVITGTVAELQEILAKLEKGKAPEGYYPSASKGLIKIKEMATAHIANALIKIYREWIGRLKIGNYANPAEFIDVLQDGFADEPYVKPLFAELYRRKDQTGWKDGS